MTLKRPRSSRRRGAASGCRSLSLAAVWRSLSLAAVCRSLSLAAVCRSLSLAAVSRSLSLAAGGLVLGGCLGEVELDAGERELEPAPVAEFDPAASIIPLPNALLIDPVTGRVGVPPSCAEVPGSAEEQLRLALNELDGFGSSGLSLVATFSEAVDPASLEGRVLLVRLAERGLPVDPPEGPVPIDVVAATTSRDAPDCSGSAAVPAVVIRPRAPLRDASTYGVLIASGVRTQSGAELEPSPTWVLVRQAEPPVVFADGAPESAPPQVNLTPFDPEAPEQLATLRGLDLLWRGHAPLLAALDQLGPALLPGVYEGRRDALLAWGFRTQTILDPFDVTIEGSPAQQIEAGAAPLVVGAPLAGEGGALSVAEMYEAAFPGVPCEALGCDAIAAIYAGGPGLPAPTFTSSSFLTGDDCTLPGTPGGRFDDPISPTLACERQVPAIAVVPATEPAAAGHPTVIFAHGLGRSKEDLLAFAGSLARAGIASVAFDALGHGERAVQISTDPALGCDRGGDDRPCAGALAPSCAPQCYAPLLSSDVAVTRDHLRQTALDQLALASSLSACASPGACAALQVDPARIGFVGQSLGALVGGVSAASSSLLSAAVLSVGGGDLVRILTETETAAIRCPLVDALIDAGVLEGEPWRLGQNAGALCLGDGWLSDPSFLTFAGAARWLLDAADGINFAPQLALEGAPAVLVAEVVGDPVVPNGATSSFAEAAGLSPEPAAPATSATPEPTPAALMAGSVWLRYQNLDADPGSGFPGNTFGHGSLLSPAEPAPGQAEGSGELGTVRMQVDTLGFLGSHLGGTP